MFGYIRVDKANLLVKEYEAYRGVYCSLCRQLGRDYSVFARFILSYDCTFYAVLMMSLAEQPPCFKAGRCRFNPLKKCNYAKNSDKTLSMAAALSVSSAYYKLLDNIHDSPWYKRIPYRLLQPIFSRWHRKSIKRYPAIDEAVGRMLKAQLEAESDPDVSIDKAADPTASMLKAVCAMIPDEITLRSGDKEKVRRILGAMGYFLGRWIYLIDAADDYDKDIKSGGFNPLRSCLSDGGDVSAAVMPMLNHALSETLLSYGLLDKGCFDPIILNVLKLSCVSIQKQVLSKYTSTSKNGEDNEESL